MNIKIKIFAAFIALIYAALIMTGNAAAAFASNESGISAYVNVGTTIDLNQASGAYKIIEDRTSTYVIGTVEVPSANEYEIPHVYTSSDGWVMAYYPKEKPRALIMPWGQFDPNNPDFSKINNTRLEEAIAKVSSAVGIDYSTIKPNTKYYDFQYPGANGLTMIAESRAINGVDSFSFRVPSEYVLYDASWEYYSYDSYGSSDSWFKLDNAVLSGTNGVIIHTSVSDGCVSCAERYFGTINPLTKDVLHKGDLQYTAYSTDEGSSNIAIVLIYKQP